MAEKWKVGDGTIYQEKGGVLYDCLDDWLDKAGQQVLCDLMNEGWDETPFDEVEPILNKQLENLAKERELQARLSTGDLLEWLESGMRKSLGAGDWYEVACAVHLGRSLRESIIKAMVGNLKF